MMGPWRIELLGELRVVGGERAITRFRTRKTALLLAYLAFHLDRPHAREELVDLLWPPEQEQNGPNNLSKALTSLRRQLEPLLPGAVLVADRALVRLRPESVTTDVALFQAALRAASSAGEASARAARLVEGLNLYRGPLLHGFDEEWVLRERGWLAEAFFQGLRELLALWEPHARRSGDFGRVIEAARRGVRMDPLREEAHRDLIRLLAAAGQPAGALQQFRELERLLREELAATPSPATMALVRRIEERRDTTLLPPRRGALAPGGPGARQVNAARRPRPHRGASRPPSR